MKAAIIGTTGYTGSILMRLLAAHPHVEQIIPVSSSKGGESILAVDHGLDKSILAKTGLTGGKLVSIDEAEQLKPDVVFGALPHLTSATLLARFLGKALVVDLSADFRLKNAAFFTKAYGSPQPIPEWQDKAVFGLCEWYRKDIQKSDLIANPGCYPTATLLPLLPLLAKGLIKGPVIVNAISGISGAGKKALENLLFCERAENVGAYNPGRTHRHYYEIQDYLNTVAPDIPMLFTPHLGAIKRGMSVTTVVTMDKASTPEKIKAAYEEYYGDAPFINLTESSVPQTGEVWGTNRCDIGWRAEGESLLLFSVIDNLVKGASGQAIQNMNIRLGFPEGAGLPHFSEV